MEWFRQVQFVSAVPMPPEMEAEFGTTVNGMWADPEQTSKDSVVAAHQAGRRRLFSVPMIALTPATYEEPGNGFLLDEVCQDIEGEPAECGWYYWESKPVYAACIYSQAFRAYLMARCREGVDHGMDVVNLDEIMTSVGLMTLGPRGCGFCGRCLSRFRSHLSDGGERSELASADNATLRLAIKRDDRLLERYRRFQEREAFRVMVGFIDDLRDYASKVNPGFAITANLAYLGNNVGSLGALWGCVWGPHVDFVMMENEYRADGSGQHLVLPRGKFTAWYKLGAAFNGAPTWICPSINVPRQFGDEDRRRYYELMFLEAYANAGRWGYFWGPGVDAAARRRASAPDPLKDHIDFIQTHRYLYEEGVSMNDIAVLYLDGPILRRPEAHQKFLGLTQALAEGGFQFDVLYGGDGWFNPDTLDREVLRRYRAILIPEADDLEGSPLAALEAHAREGGQLLVFSDSPLGPALVQQEDGSVLADFWTGYRDPDRDRIVKTALGCGLSRIEISNPGINVVRYRRGDTQVLHLLDYAYEAATDTIVPSSDVRLSIPWTDGAAAHCSFLAPHEETDLPARIDDGRLIVEVPRIDPYAVLVVRG